MTPKQYKTALRGLGLSQGVAADLLGIDRRTSTRYACGRSPVPEAVAILLAVWQHNPAILDWVRVGMPSHLPGWGDD